MCLETSTRQRSTGVLYQSHLITHVALNSRNVINLIEARIRDNESSLLNLVLINGKHLIFYVGRYRDRHLLIAVITLTARWQLQLPLKSARKIYKRQLWTADYVRNNYISQQSCQGMDELTVTPIDNLSWDSHSYICTSKI